MSSIFTFQHIGYIAIIVLLILGIMSIASWAIIIYKWFYLKSTAKSNSIFAKHYINTPKSESLKAFAEANGSIMANIYLLIKGQTRAAAEAYLNMTVREMESGFSWLSSIGATSPFVGLFGTVWGIINAFNNIGLVQSVSIATVAPGISEALVTTAAGIFVAVPAVIGYNLLYTRFSSIVRESENFLESLSHEKNQGT